MRKSIENTKARREKFASLLRAARAATAPQLTQDQLAEQVGVSQRTISVYEDGKGFPSPLTLIKLAKALGVDHNEWIQSLNCDPRYYENVQSDIRYLNPNRILTEDDLDFLKAQQKVFEPFTLRFALDLLARRKIPNPSPNLSNSTNE